MKIGFYCLNIWDEKVNFGLIFYRKIAFKKQDFMRNISLLFVLILFFACGNEGEEHMVFIEGGSFEMGNNNSPESSPQHKVDVADFYISKYEVTQEEWVELMDTLPVPKQLICKGCPIQFVSWDDVQEYIKRLNKKTGEKYRLPTESEWEYAAKGGKKSKGFLYAGSNKMEEVGWYKKNARGGDEGLKHPDFGVHPVGSKLANELGLYDMSGNVYEWCQDTWHLNYRNAPTNSNVWKGGESSRFVIRGGSWLADDHLCKNTRRSFNLNTTRNGAVGFRLAK